MSRHLTIPFLRLQQIPPQTNVDGLGRDRQPEPPLQLGAGVLNGMGYYLPAMERFSTSTLGEPKVVIPMGMGKVMLLPTAVIFWSSS